MDDWKRDITQGCIHARRISLKFRGEVRRLDFELEGHCEGQTVTSGAAMWCVAMETPPPSLIAIQLFKPSRRNVIQYGTVPRELYRARLGGNSWSAHTHARTHTQRRECYSWHKSVIPAFPTRQCGCYESSMSVKLYCISSGRCVITFRRDILLPSSEILT
jgi:hypothetical protein